MAHYKSVLDLLYEKKDWPLLMTVSPLAPDVRVQTHLLLVQFAAAQFDDDATLRLTTYLLQAVEDSVMLPHAESKEGDGRTVYKLKVDNKAHVDLISIAWEATYKTARALYIQLPAHREDKVRDRYYPHSNMFTTVRTEVLLGSKKLLLEKIADFWNRWPDMTRAMEAGAFLVGLEPTTTKEHGLIEDTIRAFTPSLNRILPLFLDEQSKYDHVLATGVLLKLGDSHFRRIMHVTEKLIRQENGNNNYFGTTSGLSEPMLVLARNAIEDVAVIGEAAAKLGALLANTTSDNPHCASVWFLSTKTLQVNLTLDKTVFPRWIMRDYDENVAHEWFGKAVAQVREWQKTHKFSVLLTLNTEAYKAYSGREIAAIHREQRLDVERP